MKLISATNLLKKIPIAERTLNYYGRKNFIKVYNEVGGTYGSHWGEDKFYNVEELENILGIDNLEEGLITLEEVAIKLNCNAYYVQHLARAKGLPYYKFRWNGDKVSSKAQYYFKPSEVEAFNITKIERCVKPIEKKFERFVPLLRIVADMILDKKENDFLEKYLDKDGTLEKAGKTLGKSGQYTMQNIVSKLEREIENFKLIKSLKLKIATLEEEAKYSKILLDKDNIKLPHEKVFNFLSKKLDEVDLDERSKKILKFDVGITTIGDLIANCPDKDMLLNYRNCGKITVDRIWNLVKECKKHAKRISETANEEIFID